MFIILIIIKTSTRVSSCAQMRGYRKKNARAVGTILGQEVAAFSTLLHQLLDTELYSNESMPSSAISGLVPQPNMLTAQAFETERWAVG